LEYEGFLGENVKIDKEIEGSNSLELLHFMRPQFVHKTGKHNAENPDSVRLRERLFREFCIEPSESLSDQFPLDKNKVILPIVEGTKKYVITFWHRYRSNTIQKNITL
jgi:hypothetical protein